ncbi:hypothetical protein EVG20_g7056, partial [Dentipellis fragilis]
MSDDALRSLPAVPSPESPARYPTVSACCLLHSPSPRSSTSASCPAPENFELEGGLYFAKRSILPSNSSRKRGSSTDTVDRARLRVPSEQHVRDDAAKEGSTYVLGAQRPALIVSWHLPPAMCSPDARLSFRACAPKR